ncbi:hypothetical protein C8Q76DRAFT_710087 [Earliella scabrosa]|nr:hypothetical protein C8Q76DRAFT_710087 [Earliella scabrosa]
MTAPPDLRRVIMMEGLSLDGNRLVEIVRQHPHFFRRLEGLLHPSFLTIWKPEGFPIAFTCTYFDQTRLSSVALPFFTPNQVSQGASFNIHQDNIEITLQ